MKAFYRSAALRRTIVIITLLALMLSLVPGVLAESTTYTVVKGDYLAKIAQTYKVTIQSILDANPGVIKNPSLIYPGMKLIIPDANLEPGMSVWDGLGKPAVTPVPAVSDDIMPVTPTPYTFTSKVNECVWGDKDGQVIYGILYVSPGFDLSQWLSWNTGLNFDLLKKINPWLKGGVQKYCGAIELPSM